MRTLWGGEDADPPDPVAESTGDPALRRRIAEALGAKLAPEQRAKLGELRDEMAEHRRKHGHHRREGRDRGDRPEATRTP